MEQQQQAQDQGIGSKTIPAVHLHAKAREAGCGIEWSLDFKNPPDNGSKAVVDLPKGSGGHDIVIRLIATQGLDIAFDTSDPIWVSEGNACPPPAGINSDQITLGPCSDTQLRIHDSNSRECVLTYQLNFVGADPLDPMIRNGGT